VDQRVKFEAAEDDAQFRKSYEKAAAEQRATALRTQISRRLAK
jgi:hypothetical protein